MGTLMGTTPHLRLLILVGSPQLLLTSREWQWWRLMVTSVPLPHPLTLYTTWGWEQCRLVGPSSPSPLFPPPGVCTMVQAWLVSSTRLCPLCWVLIRWPGLWPRTNSLSSRLLGRSPSRPLTCPVPPGVSSSPWRREISARRTSCPRRLPLLQSHACPSGPSPVLHLREYVRLLSLWTVLLLVEAVLRTRRRATSSASSAICWRGWSVGWTIACEIRHSLGSLLGPLQVSLPSHWLSLTLPRWSKLLRRLLNLLQSPQCSLLRPSLWDRLGNSAWPLPVVLLPLSHGVPLQSPPWPLLCHGSPPRWCCPRVPRLWPFLGGHRSPWGGSSFQRARWPQRLPRLQGESPCRACPLLRGRPHQHRLATRMHGSKCPTAIEHLRSLSSHGVPRLPRCTSTNSLMSPRPGLRSGQSPSLLLPPLPHQLRPWRP